MRAIWNDVVLAESDNTIKLEGNIYFPMDSLKKEYFEETTSTSLCLWKGRANYYSVNVNGEINKKRSIQTDAFAAITRPGSRCK